MHLSPCYGFHEALSADTSPEGIRGISSFVNIPDGEAARAAYPDIPINLSRESSLQSAGGLQKSARIFGLMLS